MFKAFLSVGQRVDGEAVVATQPGAGLRRNPGSTEALWAVPSRAGDHAPRASVSITESWKGPTALHLDFGSAVPLRTCVSRQLVLTNHSPIETSFILYFEYFESPPDILSRKRNP